MRWATRPRSSRKSTASSSTDTRRQLTLIRCEPVIVGEETSSVRVVLGLQAALIVTKRWS